MCFLQHVDKCRHNEQHRIFKENYEGSRSGRTGLVAWAAQSPDFNALNFVLWVGEYLGGEQQIHQLVEALCEAAVGIRNKLGHMQWHY
jgi:hypothetical protein